MSAFVINRNNEVEECLPFLKQHYKTSNNTTAVYRALNDVTDFFIPELERLKSIEHDYKQMKNALNQRHIVEELLKKFILTETKSEIEQ